MPTMPVNAAGCLIEPPVSLPKEPIHNLAATAAADPPEEPPGVKFLSSDLRFHGLITAPFELFKLADPIANSSMLVLPIMIPPLAKRLVVTVDSYSGLNPRNILEHAADSTPLVQYKSFTPMGMPSRIFSSFLS